jgi:hypothetical protein
MSETPPEETPAGAPDLAAVKAYLGGDHSWTDEQLWRALHAEQAAQARVCTIPPTVDDVEPVWPDDLREALMRRVAANLALRALPLGVMETVADAAAATTRVGANAEVARLERPFRKLVPA